MRTPLLLSAVATVALAAAAPTDDVSVGQKHDGAFEVAVRGRAVATYVHRDDTIRRPFFANLRTPGGTPVTRPHPPAPADRATGNADHADMHPGLWLAFGELGDAAFWRNKGAVVHERFVNEPRIVDGRLTFAVENRYVAPGGRTVCRETCRYSVIPRAAGYIIVADATFRSDDGDFAFGDQEEMCFGVRLARELSVKGGGRLTDSEGRRDEAGVWGKQADWCRAEGTGAGGERVTVILMPDPQNFRRSWFHARDYGLVVANPFGRKAFTGGEASRVEVRKGQSLRLRFGLGVYGTDANAAAAPHAAEEYRAFLAAIATQ